MTAIAIETCDDARRFAELREPWRRLHEASGAGPFLTWEWLYAAWRRVSPHRRLRLFLARGPGGALSGVLPLSEERRLGARVWRFLGDWTVGSDFLDVVPADAAQEEVRERLWRAVLTRDDFEALDLRDVAADSPSLGVIEAAAGGMTIAREPRYRCPRLTIGGGYEDFLRAAARGHNVRRRERWWRAQPGFAIEAAERPPDVGRALAEFFRLHQLRWGIAGGSEAVTGPEIEGFHRDAVWMLAERGMVRLYTMRLGERAVASFYILRSGGYRAMYQCGYDPAFAAQSPGLVLLARTIEDAFSEGAAVYDFLRGEEPYKRDWANGERRTVRLRVVRRTLAGSALFAAEEAQGTARRRLRRVLPASWVSAARRVRAKISAGRRQWAAR